MNKLICTILYIAVFYSYSAKAQFQHASNGSANVGCIGNHPGHFEKVAGIAAPLIAMALYDYHGSGLPLLDTEILTYSNGRSAAFNFIDLDFDMHDQNLLPGSPYCYASNGFYFPSIKDAIAIPSSVDFDSVKHSSPYLLPTFIKGYYRNYDIGGKLLESWRGDDVHLFSYDNSGNTSSVLELNVNLSGGYDSAIRHYYLYNTSGKLIQDSMEYYGYNFSTNKYGWQVGSIGKYILNNLGYPSQIDFFWTFNKFSSPNQHISNIYNSVGQLINSISIINSQIPNKKDDTTYQIRINYNGIARTAIFIDEWDTGFKAFRPIKYEFRQLNALMLPDSIWAGTYRIAPYKDTAITKILYNPQGAPISKAIYALDGTTKQNERFYYYSTTTSEASKRQVKAFIYPNPAESNLYISSADDGQYQIITYTGQIMKLGNIRSGLFSISVGAIPAGDYYLQLIDRLGRMTINSFTKK